MRALLLAGVMAFGWAGAAQAVTYTYAGSWIVGDGPEWYISPPVYSGQSAAALLFGGAASDYAISTISSAIADINYMAFYDGYGTGQLSAFQEDYSTGDVNGGTYSDSGSYSAYVHDNSCYNRYDTPAAACAGYGTQYVNYAFRVAEVADVPEPASLALLGLGAAGIVAARRRRAA